MFFVGQKVVCVDVTTTDDGDVEPLTQDDIYTVSSVVSGYRYPGFPPMDAIHLVEISRRWCPTLKEQVPYGAWRFRPLTDISIFTDMLKREPRHDLVDA